MLIDFEKQNMNPEFDVNKLSDTGFSRSEIVRDIFNKALNNLLMVCPHSRELSIVRTKLEEACFFAKKSIAIDDLNQISGE